MRGKSISPVFPTIFSQESKIMIKIRKDDLKKRNAPNPRRANNSGLKFSPPDSSFNT